MFHQKMKSENSVELFVLPLQKQPALRTEGVALSIYSQNYIRQTVYLLHSCSYIRSCFYMYYGFCISQALGDTTYDGVNHSLDLIIFIFFTYNLMLVAFILYFHLYKLPRNALLSINREDSSLKLVHKISVPETCTFNCTDHLKYFV